MIYVASIIIIILKGQSKYSAVLWQVFWLIYHTNFVLMHVCWYVGWWGFHQTVQYRSILVCLLCNSPPPPPPALALLKLNICWKEFAWLEDFPFMVAQKQIWKYWFALQIKSYFSSEFVAKFGFDFFCKIDRVLWDSVKGEDILAMKKVFPER